MYPDLSYLLHDLFGMPVDNWLSVFKTFGFFLAVSFLVSALVFAHELKRKAAEGWFQPQFIEVTDNPPPSWTDAVSSALVWFIMLGKGVYIYQHFPEFQRDAAAVLLSVKFHPVAGILGGLLAGGLTYWLAARRYTGKPTIRQVKVWPHDRISELTVSAAIGGIVGAKVFDLFDNWDAFLADPLGMLLSGGGLAIYGGLFLGFLTVTYSLRRYKIPFWPTADAVAPALVAGYGLGRVGCQLSGDGDWGIVNTAAKPGWLPQWLWSSTYPHHVVNSVKTDPVPSIPIEGCNWEYCMQLSQPVYPTPIYETLMMLVVFGILWALRKRLSRPGTLFFIYVLLISIERFFIEKIRVNVKYPAFGNLTQAEIISIGLILVAAAGLAYVYRFQKPGPTKA